MVVKLQRRIVLLPDAPEIRKECQIRGVTFEVLSDATANSILEDISSPSQNMETVVLEKHLKLPFIRQRQTTLGRCRNDGVNLCRNSLYRNLR